MFDLTLMVSSLNRLIQYIGGWFMWFYRFLGICGPEDDFFILWWSSCTCGIFFWFILVEYVYNFYCVGINFWVQRECINKWDLSFIEKFSLRYQCYDLDGHYMIDFWFYGDTSSFIVMALHWNDFMMFPQGTLPIFCISLLVHLRVNMNLSCGYYSNHRIKILLF